MVTPRKNASPLYQILTVKQPGQPLMATGVPGLPSCRLLYITDPSLSFLIDTGAEVSVLSASSTDHKRQQDFTLCAVNNTSIATFGTRSLTANLGLRRTFRWIFIVADVQKPIIGADFLRYFGLLINLKRQRLVDTHTQLNIHCLSASQEETSPSPMLTRSTDRSEYESLFAEFPEITRVHNFHDSLAQHDITHHITTCGPPVAARTRRLAPERLKVSRREFEHMLELGIIWP